MKARIRRCSVCHKALMRRPEDDAKRWRERTVCSKSCGALRVWKRRKAAEAMCAR